MKNLVKKTTGILSSKSEELQLLNGNIVYRCVFIFNLTAFKVW